MKHIDRVYYIYEIRSGKLEITGEIPIIDNGTPDNKPLAPQSGCIWIQARPTNQLQGFAIIAKDKVDRDGLYLMLECLEPIIQRVKLLYNSDVVNVGDSKFERIEELNIHNCVILGEIVGKMIDV